MKRILLTLMVLAFGLGLYAQPKISFEKPRQDYGTIKEDGGKKEVIFHFTNTGDSVLFITRVQPSCGCTASEYTKSPVPPGGKGFVSAVFDPRGYNGRFAKSISVFSNSRQVVTLIIEGQVAPREKTVEELYSFEVGSVRFESNHLAFTTIKKNEKKIRVMPVINNSKEAATIEFEQPLPPHLKLKVSPATLKPGEKGLIEGTYDANLNPSAWGNVNDLVRIRVNGVPQPNIYLYVSANLVEDFSSLSPEELANAPVFRLESNTVDFGKMPQNSSVDVEFSFINAGKSDLVIRHVRAGCGCTALMPTENIIHPGGQGTIKAKFNSGGYKGNISKSIFVYTNDPGKSETMLIIKGEVLVEGAPGK